MLALGSLMRRLPRTAVVSLIFICVLVFQLYGRSIADAKVIPEAEAAHLVRTYLRSSGSPDSEKYPLSIEAYTDPSTKGFYLYDVHGSGPGNYLGRIGGYAVNAETGDLWDTGFCKRLDSKEIAPLQKRIRDASGLSKGELERQRNRSPDGSCLIEP